MYQCCYFCRSVSGGSISPTLAEKPSVGVGAQKGGAPDDGSGKQTLAVAIPLAIIGTNLYLQYREELYCFCVCCFGTR